MVLITAHLLVTATYIQIKLIITKTILTWEFTNLPVTSLNAFLP